MLTKEEFLNAMVFFDDYNNIRDSITDSLSPYFDGNGFLFTGNDKLLEHYLYLLKKAMDLDPDDEYDPISYYLYDSSTNIYGEPDESGICKVIGHKDYKFCTIRVGGKVFEIKNAADLYDYLEYTHE